jgi:hypothetical protein
MMYLWVSYIKIIWKKNNFVYILNIIEEGVRPIEDSNHCLLQGGSSSLLASAGHSSDGRNVALWDTLLSSKRACVQSFK